MKEIVIFVSGSFTFVIYWYALIQKSEHIVLQKASTNAMLFSW